jgi:Protein of unknown function (DUF2867)
VTQPFVDEHRVAISAPPSSVWSALGRALRRQSSPLAQAYGRLVGVRPARPSGDPLELGSTLPGFRVEEVQHERQLRLAGRHRFSQYELRFTVEPDAGATVLGAHTSARFPGVHGRVYRALVIDSRAHRFLVRRLLHSIKRAAER